MTKNAEDIIYTVLGSLYQNLADTVIAKRLNNGNEIEQESLAQLEKDLRHYITDQEHLLALIQDENM